VFLQPPNASVDATCPLVVLGCLHAKVRTAYFSESNSRTLTVLVLMGLGEPRGAREVLSGYKRDTQKGESPTLKKKAGMFQPKFGSNMDKKCY